MASDDRVFYDFIKLLLDYIFAFLLLVILSPLFLILAIMIKCDSPGPVIYRQERLGKNRKKYIMYKFRSMSEDAEADGAQWAVADDPRSTKVGRFLRHKRFDELPQFINILKHEMSFVGPRPEREVFHNEFIKELPEFEHRLSVLPGITGFAQISGGYDLTPSEKLVYDLAYIKKRSIGLDAKIAFKTLRVMFSHDGAR